MAVVFIAGSMDIKRLDHTVKERIDNIVASNFEIVVGDANGADTAIQAYLFSLKYPRVTIYCSGSSPRNNVGDWRVHVVQSNHAEGSRLFFTAKDLIMADVADFGLMIWDAKSTGTLSNVVELLTRNKKSVVFVNKTKIFVTVGTIEQFEELVRHMSEHAKRKADDKIKLFDRIETLKYERAQTRMFG
jgi:hypothetical protein